MREQGCHALHHEEIRVIAVHQRAIPQTGHYVLQVIGMSHSDGSLILPHWRRHAPLAHIIHARIVHGGKSTCHIHKPMNSMSNNRIRKHESKILNVNGHQFVHPKAKIEILESFTLQRIIVKEKQFRRIIVKVRIDVVQQQIVVLLS